MPTRFSLRRMPSGWVVAAVLVFAVLALGNIRLLSGRDAPQWDAAEYFGPQFALVGDQIRSGHLLKWDPWVGAGSPDWAEPELGTTSPILLAASFLSITPQEGFIAYWMAVWAFGGIGILLLTRHLRCPAYGGAIAALGFVASGFYSGHAEHTCYIYSVSFLPWILWRLDVGLQSRDWWCGVQSGALYGLSALGGYPGFTILTPGFLLLWSLGRVLCRDSGSTNANSRPTPVVAALFLLLTIGVGAVIFSPPYSGILVSTRGYSDRIGPRPRQESISSNLWPPGAVSTLASPYLALLNLAPKALWPETDISATSVYTGAASLVLALFGWRRRSPWRWWLVLLGASFACCALGRHLPVRGWLYDFVPPTRYFRNATLFRGYGILVIGILAALATRDLVEAPVSDADRGRLWLISIFLACSSVVCFSVLVRIAAKYTPELRAGTVHLIVVWFGLAALTYALKERYLSVPHFLGIVVVLAVFDAMGALYISRPTLYASSAVQWWHEMNATPDSGVDPGSVALARVLRAAETPELYPNNRNLLAKRPVFDSYITLSNRFQKQMVADPLLSHMATGADRFWFSSAAVQQAPDDTTFARFRDRIHDLAGRPILLVHSPEQMLAISPEAAQEGLGKQSIEPLNAPACIPAQISDVSYKPNSLSFRYVAPAAGYLLVTDRWADGWELTVNGRRHPVLGGNFIFRALQVEAGANSVQFSYMPRAFGPLLFASWGTLVLIAAWQCRRLLGAALAERNRVALS